MPTGGRYPIGPLSRFTADLSAAGMEAEKGEAVARLLVLTDMLGRPTHGVALCPLYVEQLEKGLMTPSGEPEWRKDTGSTVVWDGRYLPGLWLVERALGVAFERVATHGVVSVAIRRSHHIACLAALVRLATERGFVALLATSDPAFGFVALRRAGAALDAEPFRDRLPRKPDPRARGHVRLDYDGLDGPAEGGGGRSFRASLADGRRGPAEHRSPRAEADRSAG